MSSDINVVLLSGRLAVEPELRFTARGTPAAALRLASSRYWKAPDCAEGEYRKQSVFITVETFGKTAERIAGSTHKGDALMVRGRLVYEEWVDAQGEKKRTIKLISDDVTSLPSHRPAHTGQVDEALPHDACEGGPADPEADEVVPMGAAAPSTPRKTAKEAGKIHH